MRYVVALACLLLAVSDAQAQTSDSTAARIRWRAYDQLERAGVPVERTSLHARCIADDSLSVRSLVETSLYPVNLVQDDMTPLQKAAWIGAINCATALLNLGAQVDEDPSRLGSPIVQAASQGHLDLVRLFLRHGASILISTEPFASPLMAAARNGHLPVMQLLLDQGSSPNMGLLSALLADNQRSVSWLLARMTPSQMRFAYLSECVRRPAPRTHYLDEMQRRGFTQTCAQAIAEERARQ